MQGSRALTSENVSLWLARLVLMVVFLFNITCALEFIVRPEAYAPSFELSGVPGEALVRGMGVLFLMWNATYPLAIWHPWRFRWLVLIIIVQQAIGVIGETWMLLVLPSGHEILARSALRFIVFDSGGLLAFLSTFVFMWLTQSKARAQKGVGASSEASALEVDFDHGGSE